MPPSSSVNKVKQRTKIKRRQPEYEKIDDDDDEIVFAVDKKRARYESEAENKPNYNKHSCKKEDTKAEEEEVDTREFNRRSPNGFLLPDPLPKGEILSDSHKKKWRLGKSIGLGGFGEIYLASLENEKCSQEQYIIKVEPHTNGPLFVEIHFYLRCGKQSAIAQNMSRYRLKHLGVPRFVASGSHVSRGVKYRFLVMKRFGSDLQRILDHLDGMRFNIKTACTIGIQVMDCLQFIHSMGYVHKDIKPSNLLIGRGPGGQNRVYLVDFGLCSKFNVGGLHKPYVHNKRWAHEGTLEYTSREAHIGCAGRRGDLEVLLYNLVEWVGGWLPWDRDQITVHEAEAEKFRAFEDIEKFVKTAFKGEECPELIIDLMKYVKGLQFEQTPDYKYVKSLLKKEIVKSGGKVDGKLEFKLVNDPKPVPQNQGSENKKLELTEKIRHFKNFDKLAVSKEMWEKERNNILSSVAEKSLENPTSAMQDIIDKMKIQKQHKPFNFFNKAPTNLTPAMQQVLQLRRAASGNRSEKDRISSLPMTYLLNISRPILPIQSDGSEKITVGSPSFPTMASAATLTTPPPQQQQEGFQGPTTNSGKSKRQLESSKTRKRKRDSHSVHRELKRLKPFLEEPKRTRSRTSNSPTANSSFHQAFQTGFGRVRRLVRSVTESFWNY